MEEGIIRYQRTMVYVRPKDTGLDREARMYIRVYSTLPPGTAILCRLTIRRAVHPARPAWLPDVRILRRWFAWWPP